ncbi:hypothetical protein VPNG_04161 [Cytospora leucostoma]|uniref:Gfd2/YDR514C-like C-terminal domain-containing protein n=1 Tax=Cytospora leucostoma TaxID=1230097 RepID=A0A423XD03_9PEZI|nr:hypothetical protein VPNG_04161 [Cytospora leucostoma]
MEVGDEVPVAFDGGIDVLERLLRILPSSPSLDAIIVSFDIETSGTKGHSLRPNRKEVKGVREVGFAVLDTRVMFSTEQESAQSLAKSESPTILTQQFSTSHASEDFEDCDATDFKECIFSKTFYVAKDHLVATITRCFQFPEDAAHQDTTDDDGDKYNQPSPGLRTVVIVGHSPQRDLEIIRRLGVSIDRIVPVAAIVDTYRLSRHILGTESPLNKGGHAPLQKHALSDVLTELGVPHNWHDLHNAGNDATYTLHALILLAARWAEHNGETAAAVGLCAFVEGELAVPRWTPVRKALGAHRAEEELRDPVKRLGSGLVAVATSLRPSLRQEK